MPTVIDALVVTLGLDATKFNEGQKQSLSALKRTRDDATSTAKEMQARGVQAASFFGELQKGAKGLLAIMIGGDLSKFAATQIKSMSDMGRAASAMGMKVKELDAFGKMIARNGGDAKSAAAELQNLSQVMADFRTTGTLPPQIARAFSLIGANASDSPVETVRKFAAWANNNRKNPAFVSREGQALGLDEATIDLARRKGAAGITGGMAESYRLGTISDADVEKTRAAQGALAALFQAITTNADKLVADSAVFVPLINGLTKVLTKFPELTQALMGLAVALTVLKAAAFVKGVAGLARGGGAAAAAGDGGVGGAAILGPLAGAAAVGYGGAAVYKALGMHPEAGERLATFDDIIHGRSYYNPVSGNIDANAPHIARAIARAALAPVDTTLPDSPGGPSPAWLKRGDGLSIGAAIIALMESGAKGPHAWLNDHDHFGAQGLFQWRGQRVANFQRMFGHQPKDGTKAEQLQFVQWELAHGYGAAKAALDPSKTPAQQMAIWLRYYEGVDPNSRDKKGRSPYLMDMQRGLAELSRRGINPNRSAGSNVTVTIGQITVNGVKNGKDVGPSVADAIRRNSLVQQANNGLN